MKKFLLLALLILIPEFITAQVSVRDTTIIWHTFNYKLNADNTVNWYTNTQYDTVSKIFHGIILENKYIKATLVPEFGARIISLIYKPTGHEELYQNPVGTPYGIGENWFYYKWLMVYGGIFPTLPEPEHGKAWCLPWKFEMLKETSDTVRCMMSWKDTVQLEGIDTGKWQYGKTNLRCDFTVALIKGASSLEADVALYNDSSSSLNYEYWTCLTLAPGSEPGSPKCTGGAQIIVPTKKINIPSWYPDIAREESRIPGENGVYTFTKLRYWKNWANDGIAYAWDDTMKDYWGLINHDNEEGLIRLSNNKITMGVKMWAWGYQQSQNIDPYKDPTQTHRPYVELWAGHSKEFFAPARFEANSEKKWKELYVPTTGLSNVTNANDEIIADFNIENQQSTKIANLGFVTTCPENNYEVTLEITGQDHQVLKTNTIVPDPKNGNQVNVELPVNKTWSGNDSLTYKIKDLTNNSYLSASFPLDTILTGVKENISGVRDFRLYQNYPNPFNPATTIKYSIPKQSYVTLKVYDILGREIKTLISKEKHAGNYKVEFSAANFPSGVYFYKIHAGDFIQIKKMILLK